MSSSADTLTGNWSTSYLVDAIRIADTINSLYDLKIAGHGRPELIFVNRKLNGEAEKTCWTFLRKSSSPLSGSMKAKLNLAQCLSLASL